MVVVEETRQMVPRMQQWETLITWYGMGPMKAIYTPQYMES